MAITASILNPQKRGMDGRSRIVIVSLAFTGNYVLGGDAVDFSPFDRILRQPDWVDVKGTAGHMFEYDYTNKKLFVRRDKDPANAGGADIPFTELLAAAYPAALTGDTQVKAFLTWIV